MHHELKNEFASIQSRRWFLGNCGVGMAGLALNSLFAREELRNAPANHSPRACRTSPRKRNASSTYSKPAPPVTSIFSITNKN